MAKESKPRELPEILRVPWGIRDAVLLIALWFGVQIGLGLVLGIIGNFVPAVIAFADSPSVVTSFTLYLVQVAIGLALAWVFARRYHLSWRALGWRPVNVWRMLGYMMAIFIGFIVLAQVALIIVQMLVPGFNPNQAQSNDFTQNAASSRSLVLVALVLLPPVFEETIFRGFLFPAFAQRAGVVWAAIISSAIFGIAHAQANLIVYTMVLGLLLCWLYLRTRSIIPGILVHMLNNYLAYLALAHK